MKQPGTTLLALLSCVCLRSSLPFCYSHGSTALPPARPLCSVPSPRWLSMHRSGARGRCLPAAGSRTSVACLEDSGLRRAFPGIVSPCSIKRSPGCGGFGLFADEHIMEDEPIVMLPWEGVISTSAGEDSPSWLSEGAWVQLEWQERLAAKLLFLKLSRDDDPRKEYLKLLPESHSSALGWSLEDIRELQCPELEGGILKQKAEINSSFAVVSEGMDTHDWERKVVSHADWLWAIQCVTSRAFGFEAVEGGGMQLLRGGGEEEGVQRLACLLPFIDSANHDPSIDTDISLRDGTFRLAAGFWGWEAGSEVQISYGAKSNSRLVMCHGFVIDDNPHDSVEISDVLDSFPPLQRSNLKDLGESYPVLARLVKDNGSIPFKVPARITPSLLWQDLKSTHASLSVLLSETDVLPAPSSSLDQPSAYFDLASRAEDEAKLANPSRKALAVIGLACQRALSAYPTSLGEDDAILSNLPAREWTPKMAAIKYRIEQKRILSRAIDELGRRMQGIVR